MRWVKDHRPHTYFFLATGWSELVTPEDYPLGRIDEVFKKPFAATEIVERANAVLLNASTPVEEAAPEAALIA